jgi:hypothetical protein
MASTLCAGVDVLRDFREDVVGELKGLDVGTSPGTWHTTRAYALWNASKVILTSGYISFADFEEVVKSDSNVEHALTESNIFLVRNDVERIYFQSRTVEDFMRFKFGMPPPSDEPTCTAYD